MQPGPLGTGRRTNVEVVRRMLDSYLRSDYEAALPAFVRDVEVVTSLERFFGHEGVVEEARRWEEMWSDWRLEVKELVAAGDKVVLLYHQVGKLKGSGAELEERAGWVYTLREGKIARVEMFQDCESALAAGLQRSGGGVRMSTDEVAVMRRMYEAWTNGDQTALLQVFDPDVEVRPALSAFLGSTVYRGHDGVATWYAETHEPWSELRAVPKRFIEVGHRLVAVVGLRARVPGGHVDVDTEIPHIATIRDGRIVRLDGYEEPAAALDAASAAE